MNYRPSGKIFTETKNVAVHILHIKIAALPGLVFEGFEDARAAGAEFLIESLYIINVDIGIQVFVVLTETFVRGRIGCALEVNDAAVPADSGVKIVMDEINIKAYGVPVTGKCGTEVSNKKLGDYPHDMLFLFQLRRLSHSPLPISHTAATTAGAAGRR